MAERSETDKAVRSTVAPDEIRLSMCAFCIHERGADATCKAYPDGIPARFLTGQNPHDQVEVDQVGGTVFEQDPNAPEVDAARWKA